MDEWRRKLERRNRACAHLHRPKPPPVLPTKGMTIAAIAAVAATAIWLFGHNSIVRLADRTDTSEATTVTRQLDGYDLYAAGQYGAAFKLLLPLAEQGDGEAQCRTGKILLKGLGGYSVDQVEGIKWLDLCMRSPEVEDDEDWKARELTDEAISQLGWEIVGEGRYRAFQWQQAGTNTRNGEPGMASEWVLRNLESLDGNAAFALGVDLNEGNTLPVDYEKALRCFQHAAAAGIPVASFNVGLAYYAGKGVKADPVEAIRWLKIANDGGYARAAVLLGVMAARGHGMPQDIDSALAFLKRAGDLGDPDAAAIHEEVAGGGIPR